MHNMKQEIIDTIKELCLDVLVNEPMSKHTTFRIGGAADVFANPTMDELIKLIAFCKSNEVPYMIMGNGSNMLVSDKGIEGLVISIGKNMSDISIDGRYIVAQAGALLSATANRACDASLTGFEFAAGIPGTVGGAVVMNAGAYGGQIADCIVECEVLTAEGTIVKWTKDMLDLDYRHSVFMDCDDVILSAVFELTHDEASSVRNLMEELRAKRIDKQPLNYPSAGSTFKRPQGYFAGKLIEDAGLKGYCVGGAQVSETHCGFVVNKGDATCEDVLELIKYVDQVVYEKNNVHLEPEIRIVGRF